jgi:hypothetical protein
MKRAQRCTASGTRWTKSIINIFQIVTIFLALFAAADSRIHAQGLECRGVQKPQQVAELMFGFKVGDRVAVNEYEWSRFLDREITPRFPNGLTVFAAASQWRDQASNKIVREPSRIVLIVLPGEAEDLVRLDEVVRAYKTRFKQQSVGIILRAACVSF